MKTWLFVWNPELNEWNRPVDGLEETCRDVKNCGVAYTKWTCGNTTSIEPGDRIFMVRLGVEPKGIFASGKAMTKVFEGTHWDQKKREAGIKAKRIYICFDKVLDCKESILPMERLEKIPGGTYWEAQASGMELKGDVPAELEKIWAAY